MKRTVEFALGLVVALLGILGIALSFFTLSSISSPESMNAMAMSGMDVDMTALMAETARTTYINSIIAGVLAVVSLVSSFIIRKNRATLICGVIFLAVGSFGFFFGYGFYIGSIVAVVAGILCVVRQEKEEKLIYVEDVEG